MNKYRVNIGVNLKAKSLDDIKEVVFALREMVALAAKGKGTHVSTEILGCEQIKDSD